MALMNPKWLSITETDGELGFKFCKLSSRGKALQRNKVDSFSQFYVRQLLSRLNDSTCRENGFYNIMRRMPLSQAPTRQGYSHFSSCRKKFTKRKSYYFHE